MIDDQQASAPITSDPKVIVIAAIILLIAAAVLARALVGRANQASALLPNLATATVPPVEEGQPIQLTFAELNAEPLTYLNQSIQVSGTYLPLEPPACAQHSGPVFRWALISDELQLDVQGYERIVRILPPETDMTLRGKWRLYQGPLGCGKGPARDSAWFLQVEKIVEPNPLIGAGVTVNIENSGSLLPQLLPTMTLEPTPMPSATATETMVATPTPTLTLQPIVPTVTLDPNVSVTMPATLTPSVTPPATLTPTAPGTPGASVTPSATPTTGAGGGTQATSTPESVITATSTSSSGYPGPPTSTPTASPDPYA
ncbi:MAG: hypothetical protein ACK2UK_19680 [Candidatus Promineifilaceae bacterium]